MNTLYDKQAAEAIIGRIELVKSDDKPQWGKMNAAQMMAHCAQGVKVMRNESQIQRSFIGYVIGPIFKKAFYNEKPFAKNSPTAKEFIFPEETDFEQSKHDLIDQIRKLGEEGPEKCTRHPHAFFGKLSPEQWGQGIHKHTDHHLRQFGV